MNGACLKAQFFPKHFYHSFYSSLYLGKASGENEGTAETIHKTNLYVSAFHCNIGSHDNSLPGSKTDKPNGLAGVVLALVNADVERKILINTGL